MKKSEQMLLADAISTAIKAEKENSIMKRIIILLIAVCIALAGKKYG